MAEAVVIIPHYNDTTRLGRCLAALAPQLTRDTEVVVVDNNSTESLDALRAAWPSVRFIVETQKGAANARNRGVAETTAPLLLFLDSDCLPADDWLATARAVAGRGDLVGGRVDVFDETPPPRTGAQAFEAVFAFDMRGYVERKGFAGSGNLVTRREVFEDVGPFIHGKSEDLDWSHRATAKGYRLVYADELAVGHPSRNDWAALWRKWKRVNDESFGLLPKGAGSRARWFLRALAMPVSILAHAPKVLRSERLTSGGEKLRALGTLARLRFARMGQMMGQALRG